MEIPIAYDARLFVTPKEARRRVTNKVKRWSAAQAPGLARFRIWGMWRRSPELAPGDQVMALTGERGAGKTWLLRHLAEQEYRTARCALYLDLEERRQNLRVEDYVQGVEERIRKACGADPALLLLDHVPPQLDEHLKVLEDIVLRPHLAHRRSLVIMALAHPAQVCWRAPALRGGQVLALPPFDEAETRAQLRQLEKAGSTTPLPPSPDLLQLSEGLPLLNYLLATRGRSEAYELLLEYWFSRVPADERHRVRGYLDAVCNLETLEHVSIQRMLEVYHHYWFEAPVPLAHAGGVRNVLRKYWLAGPAPDAPGRIILIGSVRRAAQEVLRARNAELASALEAVA
ncbi:MAG: AAA family ATPase [Anaerolineae bacterium]|jgi:hypothetical protein